MREERGHRLPQEQLRLGADEVWSELHGHACFPVGRGRGRRPRGWVGRPRARPRWRSARPGCRMATTRPPAITASRSHSRSASSMKWVTSTTVTPRSRTARIRSQVSRRACGSRPVVSSSRMATRGLPTRASAIDRRCFWPPESLPNAGLAACRPGPARPSARASRPAPVEGAVELQRLPYLDPLGQLALLQLDADAAGAPGRGRRAGRAPAPGPCRGRPAQALDASRPSWSCRRRWARRCRRSPRPRPRS